MRHTHPVRRQDARDRSASRPATDRRPPARCAPRPQARAHWLRPAEEVAVRSSEPAFPKHRPAIRGIPDHRSRRHSSSKQPDWPRRPRAGGDRDRRSLCAWSPALAILAATTSARMRSACIALPDVSINPNRFIPLSVLPAFLAALLVRRYLSAWMASITDQNRGRAQSDEANAPAHLEHHGRIAHQFRQAFASEPARPFFPRPRLSPGCRFFP